MASAESPASAMPNGLHLTISFFPAVQDDDVEERPSFLPPFANAENRALDAYVKVSWIHRLAVSDALQPIAKWVLVIPSYTHVGCSQKLEKQLELVDVAVEENSGRIGVMAEHLKNVQQEITYTESRVRYLLHMYPVNASCLLT